MSEWVPVALAFIAGLVTSLPVWLGYLVLRRRESEQIRQHKADEADG